MNYRDAQRLYLEAGWPGVLPLPARAKFPPPEGYTGRGAPYPDERQLEAWRNGPGDGNLCLRLPEGVLGIDVDAYDGKPGAETLARLEAELGALPETWVSSAREWPSGIRFFRVPAGRAWRDPGPGLEVIHAGWRYAVAWPSLHPVGDEYIWHRLGTVHKRPPNLSNLPDLPEAWVRYLDAGEARPYVTSDVDTSWLEDVAPKQGSWGPCPIMLDSTSRHLDEIRAGAGRHDAMLRGVSAVVHLAVNGHRGGMGAVLDLRDTFQQVTTDRSTWGEFNRALTGALQKEGASLSVQSPPCRCGAPAPETSGAAMGPALVEGTNLYLSITELAKMPKPASLIEGVLDGGSLFAITGRDGVYKSFVAFDWLACLATGQLWYGHEVEQGRVLYVLGEGVYGIPGRAAAWQQYRGVDIGDNVLSVRIAPVNLFKGGPAYDELAVRIVQEGYRVVIFDTLQRMASGGDLNSSKDASLVIERLDVLRKSIPGGAVGFVGHTGKSDLDTRGSSVLEDDVDIVWRLKRGEDEDSATLSMHKRKDGPVSGEMLLTPKSMSGTGSIVMVQTTRQAVRMEEKQPRHAQAALEILAGRTAADGLSYSRLAQELHDRGAGKGNSSIQLIIEWLLDKGYLTTNKAGGYQLHRITESGRAKLVEIGTK